LDRPLYAVMMTSSPRPILRALISVADRAGITAFAGALVARSVALISSGGSARFLAAAGLPVTEVADITGFPEMLDGRVKTLHPVIHAGLLALRDRPDHLAALAEQGIAPIDLLVCNLYPFARTVASGASPEDCVENIDIGGVALIRAAAKNHDAVAVVTDPDDYERVVAEFNAGDGTVGAATRRALALKAFAMTAAYDAAIAEWMGREERVVFPQTLVLAGRLAERLRYGENPHQSGAFYTTSENRPGVATARQLQGKELSYNNYADADAAFELVAEFVSPAAAIIKHANPCGAAIGATLREAWDKALACDPVSAFGGIVALNRSLDPATAEAIGRLLIEVVIAPQVEEEAISVLARKTSLRLLVTGGIPDTTAPGRTFRSLSGGGILVQERDRVSVGPDGLRTVTRRGPSETELADLLFADKVAKHVKSNAIVFVRSGATVGIGAGQMSRVDSVKIAAAKAAEAGKAAGLPRSPSFGSVVASDAFFPFADGVEAAIGAGATAIIQPGGSLRDEEVIAAANAAGMAMVFTGLRHFRH
jgi:phosphoribosylaminoimidazolecarboxamide formyltransferase / IMP cyclohydrolase